MKQVLVLLCRRCIYYQYKNALQLLDAKILAKLIFATCCLFMYYDNSSSTIYVVVS